jgi:hypothetical protein
MGWPRRDAEEWEVQEELLISGNARNRKTIKILARKYLGGDHGKLREVFSTASLYMRYFNQNN